MKLKLHTFDLPIKHTFTISRGSIDVQPTLIVELEQDGICGFGEATTNTYYGITAESMISSLEKVRSHLSQIDLSDPRELWAELDGILKLDRFAQCALDQAAYDLWGKLNNQPTHQMLGLDVSPENLPVSNFTIGIDEIPTMLEKMQEVSDWPIYKIKLGTENDLEIIRTLRENSDAIFRVDANCGWDAARTIEYSGPLKDYGVEFIEQPLPADAIDEFEKLRSKSELPLIADESCLVEEDVKKAYDLGFDGINIKLVKCGGITPALRMIEHARKLDLNVMIGCMVESSVGISAIGQLLPLLDYVDMDGADLLSSDIATGIRLDRGQCIYSELNGNGVAINS